MCVFVCLLCVYCACKRERQKKFPKLLPLSVDSPSETLSLAEKLSLVTPDTRIVPQSRETPGHNIFTHTLQVVDEILAMISPYTLWQCFRLEVLVGECCLGLLPSPEHHKGFPYREELSQPTQPATPTHQSI